MDFWDLFWLFFIFIPITVLWLTAVWDCIGRPDLSGWKKAGWMLAAIVFPVLGSMAYVIFRPPEYEIAMVRRDREEKMAAQFNRTQAGTP